MYAKQPPTPVNSTLVRVNPAVIAETYPDIAKNMPSVVSEYMKSYNQGATSQLDIDPAHLIQSIAKTNGNVSAHDLAQQLAQYYRSVYSKESGRSVWKIANLPVPSKATAVGTPISFLQGAGLTAGGGGKPLTSMPSSNPNGDINLINPASIEMEINNFRSMERLKGQ
jgi:hypothetical protein